MQELASRVEPLTLKLSLESRMGLCSLEGKGNCGGCWRLRAFVGREHLCHETAS